MVLLSLILAMTPAGPASVDTCTPPQGFDPQSPTSSDGLYFRTFEDKASFQEAQRTCASHGAWLTMTRLRWSLESACKYGGLISPEYWVNHSCVARI